MVIITRLLLTALTLLIVGEFIPGISLAGPYAAIIAAVILSLLNMFIRPILFILTLPINVLTLGLFIFIINAALFWFAASFIQGFTVEGFWPALVGSVIVSLVSTLGARYIK